MRLFKAHWPPAVLTAFSDKKQFRGKKFLPPSSRLGISAPPPSGDGDAGEGWCTADMYKVVRPDKCVVVGPDLLRFQIKTNNYYVDSNGPL